MTWNTNQHPRKWWLGPYQWRRHPHLPLLKRIISPGFNILPTTCHRPNLELCCGWSQPHILRPWDDQIWNHGQQRKPSSATDDWKVGIRKRQNGTPSRKPSKKLMKQRRRSGHSSINREDMKTWKAPPYTSPESSRQPQPYTYLKRKPWFDPSHGGMER